MPSIFGLQIAFNCSSRSPFVFHRGSAPASPGQVDFIASSFALIPKQIKKDSFNI